MPGFLCTLPCEHEACLRLAESFSLAALVILSLPKLHLRRDPLATTSRPLDHGVFQ